MCSRKLIQLMEKYCQRLFSVCLILFYVTVSWSLSNFDTYFILLYSSCIYYAVLYNIYK